MNEEIKKLIEQEQKIRNLRMKAQAKYRQEELRPLLQSQVGKCFKYRNSYGTNNDSWWLYEKVISLTDDGDFYCEKFQTDCFGEISINYMNEVNYDRSHFENRDWKKISIDEYNKAKLLVIKTLREKGFLTI